MIKKIFLIGNPNVGKSVLFSRLTGVEVMSSNYPGTTVEIRKGFLGRGEQKCEVIDLPGTYSLTPTSKAEEVTATLLKDNRLADFTIVNIIDATNLERNLNLTLQLLERGMRVVVCLNMFDETKHRGISIDVTKLAQLLGVPVVPTCALTGAGVKELLGWLEQGSHGVMRTPLDQDMRWQEIGRITMSVQTLTHRHHTLREILEDASLKPFPGSLISAAVLFASFQIVRFIGEMLIAKVFDPVFINLYEPLLKKLSVALGSSGFWHNLLIGNLVRGHIDFKQSMGLLTTAPYIEFAMVLPYIVAFYLVLGILEDTGFLPRFAMLVDSFFHRLGLHGFAIIPVLLGFGCNVPGILATRVLESKKERFIATTLISIAVPCVPLQAMIFGILGSISGLYVAAVYLVLFAIWLMVGSLLRRIIKGDSPEFLLEIPPYRVPSVSLVFKKLFLRVREFVFEAAPMVLLGVLLVNILFTSTLFGWLSAVIAPILKVLFGLPQQAVVALVIGFFRKDVAAGMLIPLALNSKQLFISTVLLAVSFPCIATFAIILRELGPRALLKSTAVMVATGIVIGVILNLAIVY